MTITTDEVLDLLSFAGTELVNGNANHGPMASEALFALGRDDAVQPWIDGYRSRLTLRPAPSLAIPASDWRNYLGVRERLGDWIQLFETELAELPWQEVVRLWVAKAGSCRYGRRYPWPHSHRSCSLQPFLSRHATAQGRVGPGSGFLGRQLLHPPRRSFR